MAKLTFKEVKSFLRSIDITITETSNVPDEWRVNLKGGKEATAYYATDLQDALDTGKSMSKQQWSSGSGRFYLEMSVSDAESASHQGSCDDDVKALSRRADIAKQLEAIDADDLRAELKEYGCWDTEELADHDQNIQRILWLAAGSILDEMHERQR